MGKIRSSFPNAPSSAEERMFGPTVPRAEVEWKSAGSSSQPAEITIATAPENTSNAATKTSARVL